MVTLAPLNTFNPNLFMMYLMANCAFTELPEPSKGGAKADTPNTCVARKRDWSVVPDNSGDGTDALIYKGSLKANGEKIKGTATTTDNWQTCTFVAD